MSTVRKSILNDINKQYPKLSPKTIIYVESDMPYYGLPIGENVVPFQSGFGQTLLVWYYFHGDKLPSCFFENSWLYDLLAQGYRSCLGQGFGYFRHYDDLVSGVKNYDISLSSVIAFSWNSDKGILTNTTNFIRAKLTASLK